MIDDYFLIEWEMVGMNRAMRMLPAIVCMAVIYYLSNQTGDDLGSLLPYFQKLFPALKSFDAGHFVAYFILALTYYLALFPRSIHPWGKVLVIVLCLLYGVSDEYHQSFVADRSPDVKDLRNDGIGATIAMLVLIIPAIDRQIRKRFLS